MISYRSPLKLIFAGTFVASQAMAEPIDYLEPNHTVDATEQVLKALEPTLEKFKEFANRDVFVLSADRLLGPNELRQATIYLDMSVSPSTILSDEEVLDSLYRATEGLQGSLRENIVYLKNSYSLNEEDKARFITAARGVFDTIIEGQAMATSGQLDQCMIIAPRDNLPAQNLIGQLAYMPEKYLPNTDPSISSNLIFNQIMAHEAEHCDQERRIDGGIFGIRLQKVEGENDADEASFEAIKGLPFAEEAINATRATRYIGNLRSGSDFYFQSPQTGTSNMLEFEVPAHIFFPNDTSDNLYDYNEADIVIAAKLVQTAANIVAGALHQTTVSNSDNPNFEGLSQVDYSGDMLRHFAEIGRTVNYEYPEIQYALLKTMGSLFFERYLDDSEVVNGIEHTVLRNATLIARDMVQNYVTAMETYYPDVVNSRLAQSHIAQFNEALKLAKENTKNNSLKDPTRESSLSALDLEIPQNSSDALLMMISIASIPSIWSNEPVQPKKMKPFVPPPLAPGP
ncbi:MAG: hypothetical protein AAF988_04520 [Pseudomonadota bacterium]